MGTRSATGFRLHGKDVLAYNQHDGYPESCGQAILDEIREDILKLGLHEAVALWVDKARTVKIVSTDGAPPTAEDIKALAPYTNLNVSNRSETDWYCLLRELHNSIIARLKSGYFLDQSSFIEGSLFCEWAYILNLDEETLEIYRGFQKTKPKGRYADVPPDDGYYACSLIATLPLGIATEVTNLKSWLEGIGAIEIDSEEAA